MFLGRFWQLLPIACQLWNVKIIMILGQILMELHKIEANWRHTNSFHLFLFLNLHAIVSESRISDVLIWQSVILHLTLVQFIWKNSTGHNSPVETNYPKMYNSKDLKYLVILVIFLKTVDSISIDALVQKAKIYYQQP